MDPKKWRRPLALLALAGLVFLAQNYAGAYYVRVLIIVAINAVLVVALNLSNGFTGVFSLGHVGFMAMGAYISSILTLPVAMKATNLNLPHWLAGVQLGFLPATLIAAVITVIVAVIIGWPLMRLSGHYVTVATLGFLVIVRVVLINADSYTRGARTFSGVPPYTNLWWAVGWLVLTIYAANRLIRSPYGRAMIAVREDPLGAQSVGVSILGSRQWAFGTSAFFTAIGGALYAHFLSSFSPAAFYFSMTFNLIIMLVVGGMGSITGSVLGAAGITLISEFFRNLERGGVVLGVRIPPLYGMSQIVMAVLFMIIIVYRPIGIMGQKELSWSDVSRWLSARLRPPAAGTADTGRPVGRGVSGD